MGNFNRVILAGNLTRDVEIRYVQSGSAVAKFTLAVNRKSKNGDETTFVDIVAWDNGNYKLAETCNTYLKKGMNVLVEGRLSIRSYDDKGGNKRKSTEVVIDSMQMFSGNPNSSGGGGRSQDNVRGGGGSTSSHDDELLDDEIPFRSSPVAERVQKWWLD